MKKFIKNHKGVTMMEVLVTVALLAIVIVPCLSSFVMAQKGNALAAQTQNEYTQAQNLMEELKAKQDVNEIVNELKQLDDDKQPILNKVDGNGIYVIYKQEAKYVTVWIFKTQVSDDGYDEHYNSPYDESNETQLTESELILKGVIAP